MTASNFKVIVIGGGPSGLVTAHALHLAGIDFIVLEGRTDIVEDLGASLVLGPPSMRIMHQFGIFERLMDIGCEINVTKSFDFYRHEMKHSTNIQNMRKNHGLAPVAFHRAQLVETLYDSLPVEAKEKVILGKKLDGIESGPNGVTVTCVDGSTYEGSIVIGADGVHSKTRRCMRQLALRANPSQDWDPEIPFQAHYRCLWASFKNPAEHGQNYDTQHKDRSLMYITGKERGWMFLYQKLPEPTTQRTSFNQADIEAFADGFKDFPANETLYARDLWARRVTTGMANLEEGILTNWSWGRIVLVGDACHKFTPNAGLGLNNGIQDVVLLCNGLREAVCSDPSGKPGISALSKIFKGYQETRKGMLKPEASQSAQLTRMQSWASTPHYVMSKYVMSTGWVEYLMINTLAANGIRQALVLDYVPGEEPIKGRVSWKNPIPSPKAVLE
ncbi:FAD-dependent monooxygenase sdnN [Colletotrichum sp. SAR11_240]|nr:FAD-dependent monooxygenase sdnN [Colletotrichum sp. SAR11_240]